MYVCIFGAFLTHLALNCFRNFYPSFPLSQEMSLIITVIGGAALYLGRKVYMNVVLQTCSCYCGPGKCECTCGCREKCECYFRNKEEYYTGIRRRGTRYWS